jgi:hypothetical protein
MFSFALVTTNSTYGICRLDSEGKFENPYANFTLLETLRFYTNATMYNNAANDEFEKVMTITEMTLP